MDLPTVTVVIPTWGRASTLEMTLTALGALDYPHDRLEIIVVDNGSTDSTAEVVRRFPYVRYVWQEHTGVAKARNHGARLATGEVLMFLDDDILVEPDNIRRHVTIREQFRDHPDCIVAGHSEFADDVRRALEQSPFGRYRLWMEDATKDEHRVRWGAHGQVQPITVATQNLSIGRRFFWQLNGFDEQFPSIGAEDQDLSWRARAAGCAIVHDYDIRVVHNDQHRDLLAVCRREQNGAVGTVCLVRKHPDFPRPNSLELNGPLRRTDSPRLIARKLVRSALSQELALRLMRSFISGAERLRPNGGWPLNHLYRAITGLYVFRGVRKGLRYRADGWAEPINDI